MTVLPPDTKDFQTSAQYHNLYSQTDVNKHFTSGDQTTDNKLYIDGDNLSASVSVKLLGSSDYEGGLKTLEINDDYTNFANNVSYVSAKMLRDGQDVSTDWTFENKDGHVIATAKDPVQIVAGTYTLQPTWMINTDLASGTVLTNNGSITVNDSTGKVPPVNVPVYKPTDDKHWVEGNSVVDNKTYINDDTVHGRINMSLPDPTQLANPLSEVSVTDDYSQAVKYLDYDSASVQENVKSAQAQVTKDTNKLSDLKQNLTDLQNAPALLAKAQQAVKDAQAQVDSANQALADAKAKLTPLANAVQSANDALAAAQQKLASAKAKQQTAEANLAAAKEALKSDAEKYANKVVINPINLTEGDQLPEPQIANSLVIPVNLHSATNKTLMVLAATGNSSAADLPAGTTATWANRAQVLADIQHAGNYTEDVLVTFPDGSSAIVKANVKVAAKNAASFVTPGNDSQSAGQTNTNGSTTNTVNSNVAFSGNGTSSIVSNNVEVTTSNQTSAKQNADAKTLPQTGNNNSAAIVGLGLVSAFVGLLGLRKFN